MPPQWNSLGKTRVMPYFDTNSCIALTRTDLPNTPTHTHTQTHVRAQVSFLTKVLASVEH